MFRRACVCVALTAALMLSLSGLARGQSGASIFAHTQNPDLYTVTFHNVPGVPPANKVEVFRCPRLPISSPTPIYGYWGKFVGVVSRARTFRTTLTAPWTAEIEAVGVTQYWNDDGPARATIRCTSGFYSWWNGDDRISIEIVKEIVLPDGSVKRVVWLQTNGMEPLLVGSIRVQ